jgi:glucose-1-phosphate thymidylyltransferase
VIIGKNCEIGPNVYIGPYTSIDDETQILSGEVEGSIIMKHVIINCRKRITDSIIGRHARIESSDQLPSSGLRFVLGENTLCRI